MEAILENLERFVEVLAVSQSKSVKDWDNLILQRAFQWSAYFQHIHQRFQTHVLIRTALEDRLWVINEELKTSMENYRFISFEDLGFCDEILYAFLLQNPALPKVQYEFLLSELKDESKPMMSCISHIFRQKAASQMLLSITSMLPNSLSKPLVLTQAHSLKKYLENRTKHLNKEEQLDRVSEVLSQVPKSHIFQLVAAVLAIDDIDTNISKLLVQWLVVDMLLFENFCSNLSCELLAKLVARNSELEAAYLSFLTKWGESMDYDIMNGYWSSNTAERSWEKLQDHFSWLLKGPQTLREATESTLKNLIAQDGNFNVYGISIWTDLLLVIKGSLSSDSAD
uniref:Fanconi anemia group F protein n=1 Tax=Geotrypetes seraphini TaxID=260995 RepID=A0A6P8S4C7_GEOSA|nr:Fanconi anemia group F protein [Geotrypetes seraphini]XP_033813010.1 Fanconi anemia group F protein [Geotrypetes seraphini]XP_033813011.1 Fanconi anemia group F protein [Geotrypetes seraphini]XP_033813012.1 Fanconi anemia group F protein [Geotrypetes seraphini]XP_033813013.1 Fanconi anemia group F protein [Geotrypetes seraphini]XP_033813015.1 Fanconi anemia group F protein [Geotrypetes seraphini]